MVGLFHNKFTRGRNHMNILSVVIPAYNEEDGVAEVIERVLAVEPELKRSVWMAWN